MPVTCGPGTSSEWRSRSHAQDSFLLSGHKSTATQKHPLAGMADLGPVPELALALHVTEPGTATSSLNLSLGHMTELDSVLSQVPFSIQGLGMRFKTANQVASVTVPRNIFKTHPGCCEQTPQSASLLSLCRPHLAFVPSSAGCRALAPLPTLIRHLSAPWLPPRRPLWPLPSHVLFGVFQ